MEQSKTRILRCALSGHLTLLALLTTIVVSTGSGSVFMPCLILLVGVFSFLFVDWLEWFTLNRVLAYFGMILGTITALADYCWGVLYADSPAHQLYAVASLLVYPQAILLLQRKNVRIFEQLAIFLLLEVVVASLVNDSLLFGLLLTPIVLLWVSSLFLMARYTAIIKLDSSLEIATPRLVELIVAYLRTHHFAKRRSKQPTAQVTVFATRAMRVPNFGKLFSQTLPIGVGASVFSCLYFGLLPRMEGSNYSIPQALGPRTGFSRSLTLGMTGKLLQDSTPALRLKLTHYASGKPYTLFEPPYIRGAVYGDYGLLPTSYSGEFSWNPLSFEPDLGKLPELERLARHYKENRDVVRARFEVLSDPGAIFTIAPFFSLGKKTASMAFFPFDWRVSKFEEASFFNSSARNSYEFGTLGFSYGANVPIIPFDNGDFTSRRNDSSGEAAQRLYDRFRYLSNMTTAGSKSEDEQSFKSLIALKERILSDAGVPTENSVLVARTIQDYFVSSGEFTYSLDLTMQRDLSLNPIEDFVANQRKGHCQYFASALALMLRHSGIPTRLVAGYHPNEFNQLGKYFVVRNSDAHVWVEAFFSSLQILASGTIASFSAPQGGWLTLDPTPAGEGSNAGTELVEQPGQAIDYAQQLWSDYVIEANHLSGDSSLYASLAARFQEAYDWVIDESLLIFQATRRGDLLRSFLNQENWYSWRMAFLMMFLGGGIVFMWRLIVWLPKLAPRIATQLGLRHAKHAITQQFFVRCLKLLSGINFRRTHSQTPQELTQAAASYLLSRNRSGTADESLSVLTSAYYKMRFGHINQLSKHEMESVEQALDALQRVVSDR